MSRMAEVNRVDVQIQGHTIPDGKKIIFLYAFERVSRDAKLSISLEPDIVDEPDFTGMYLKPTSTGLIKRFTLEGEGLEVRDPIPPTEPLEAIILDSLYEARIECRRCHQRISGLEYVTHTLAELVVAAREHLSTCSPVEES